MRCWGEGLGWGTWIPSSRAERHQKESASNDSSASDGNVPGSKVSGSESVVNIREVRGYRCMLRGRLGRRV